MAFADFAGQKQAITLLQRSLERGRLAHAYLFSGHQISELEAVARTLAKTLNCQQPKRASKGGPAVDCCDACLTCRNIDSDVHADIHWVRPESKSRIITVDQMRDLMHEIHLKPNDAEFKVAVIAAADRLNPQAANAFLKTLEEPPAKSIVILLTTDSQRLLETVVSRCLRLNFGAEDGKRLGGAQLEWLKSFAELAAVEQKSLLGRYRLLGVVLKKLGEVKELIEKSMTARSPLERYDDIDPRLREKWEAELAAAVEAEYRLRRMELLAALQWWMRDVWLQTLKVGGDMLNFPQMAGTGKVAGRISSDQATQNLRVLERIQRLLGSNVQEALALEVGLLELSL